LSNKLSDFFDSKSGLKTSAAPSSRPHCSGCNRLLAECVCKKRLLSQNLKPALRIEKKGRGGKVVTVLFKLPAHETLLKELCAHLKRALGAGGTHYIRNGEGYIELQGDRRDSVLSHLQNFIESP